MVNPEIITALKNALDHGENLDQAKQVLINSGYNVAEIQEASKFIGGGAINMQQVKPGEELTMPRKKGILGKFAKTRTPQPATVRMPNPPRQIPTPQARPQQTRPPASANQIQRLVQQPQTPQQPPQQPQTPPQAPSQPMDILTTPQPISMATPQSEIKPSEFPASGGGELTKDIGRIKPAGQSHAKEIILLVVLLILIAILIFSFVFKDKIVDLFSFFLSLL